MILVDANQIAISHLMVRQKIEDGINIDSIRKSIVKVLARIAKGVWTRVWEDGSLL